VSSSFYLHVGPYLRCSASTKPRFEDQLVCSKVKKHHQGADVNVKKKHCPECGAPTKTVSVRVAGKDNVVSRDDVEEAIGEDSLSYFNSEYAEKGIDLYTANEDRKAPREFQVDSSEGPVGEIVEVDPDLIMQEIKWFSTAFAKEIAAIQKLYGTSNVSILWGVLGEIM
jgi:hypothetical protein